MSKELLELLTKQDNVVALWQLDDEVRRAATRARRLGHWRDITERVYLAAPSDPTHEQRLWAASLHAGKDSVLAGQAALYASGWKHDVAEPFDVLVARDKNPLCPKWIRLHRTNRLLTSPKQGMPRSQPVDACLDAAAWARTNREAAFVVITALSKQLVKPRELEREAGKRALLPRRELILETLTEFAGGVMSMGELDFSGLCRQYGIRPPDRQVRRTSSSGQRCIDAYWDAEHVLVEIDGAGHADVEVMRDDHERQNDFVIQGDRIFLRVFAWVLKYEPEIFMSQLAQVVGMA